MMEIDNRLGYASLTCIDPRVVVIFSLLVRQAVDSEEVTIHRLNDMLLSVVAIQGAQIREIRAIGNGMGYGFLLATGAMCTRRREAIEQFLGLVVAEANDGLR